MRWAVLAACLACYGATLGAQDLIRDDHWLIGRNPLVAGGWSAVPRILSTGYVEAVEGASAPVQEYRPLLTLSYWAQRRTTGRAAWPMRAVNVALHAAVSLLLLELLRRRLPRAAADAGAAVFAVLPIHTEAVSYITSRSELMSAAFMLAAWLCLEPGARRLKSGLAFFCAALLSKEHAFLFPGLLALDDWAQGRRWRDRLSVYGALAACAALYLAARAVVLSRSFHAGTPYFQDASFLVEALTVARFMVTHNLWSTLSGTGLCADFSRPLIPDSAPDSLSAWACLALFAGIAAAAAIAFSRRRIWGFWVLAPLFFLLPTCHLLIPIDTLGAERMLYFPSIGFCAVLGLAYGRVKARPWARPALAAVLAWYLAATILRNRAWASEPAFYEATLRCNPAAAKVRSSLGAYWLARGRADEGLAHLRRAMAMNPALAHPHYNLAVALHAQGRRAEAKRAAARALELDPASADGWMLMGVILDEEGSRGRALQAYEKCLAILPWHPEARFNLGRHHLLGGRPDLALPELRRFVELAPDDPDAPAALSLARRIEHGAR